MSCRGEIMITKKLYMGEFDGELEIIIRGGDVYLTDMDDDECVHIPRGKLQEVSNTIDLMLSEYDAQPRHEQ